MTDLNFIAMRILKMTIEIRISEEEEEEEKKGIDTISFSVNSYTSNE
tara:strand:+ start:92 stop:232 length:141 start_codon:yes stop_codon:yes gene_type:complete